MDSAGIYTVLLGLSYALVCFTTGENPPGCNRYIKYKSGNLTSPGYPFPYPDQADCTYIIGVSTLSYIEITFYDVQFETGYDCLYYGSGRIADTQNFDGKIVSSSSRVETDSGMWFKLVTDLGINYRGFALSWNIADYCGDTYTHDSGTLTSPNFPGLYPSNVDCLYIIKLNHTSRIHITSNTFSIEEKHDYLQYGIETTDGNQFIGSFSGEHIGVSSLDLDVVAMTMWLRFTSDYGVEYTGFNMSWHTEDFPSTTLAALSTTISPSSTFLTVASDPAKEPQRQTGDVVLKTVVGIIIGIVGTILLIVVGMACYKRFRKQLSSSSYMPPTIRIEPREPPSGLSMDDRLSDESKTENTSMVSGDLNEKNGKKKEPPYVTLMKGTPGVTDGTKVAVPQHIEKEDTGRAKIMEDDGRATVAESQLEKENAVDTRVKVVQNEGNDCVKVKESEHGAKVTETQNEVESIDVTESQKEDENSVKVTESQNNDESSGITVPEYQHENCTVTVVQV